MSNLMSSNFSTNINGNAFCGNRYAPLQPHNLRWSGSGVKTTTGGGFSIFALHRPQQQQLQQATYFMGLSGNSEAELDLLAGVANQMGKRE